VTQVGFGFPGADGLRLGSPWRESSDHVGWAPLPPEVPDDSPTRVGDWVDNYYDIGPAAYLFVKIGDLSRPNYRDVILRPANNVEFFSRTKNVTDIVYGGDVVCGQRTSLRTGFVSSEDPQLQTELCHGK
jgi:hypothetical protein